MKQREDFNYQWFEKNKSPIYAKVIRCSMCNKFASWTKVLENKRAINGGYKDYKCHHCGGLLNC